MIVGLGGMVRQHQLGSLALEYWEVFRVPIEALKSSDRIPKIAGQGVQISCNSGSANFEPVGIAIARSRPSASVRACSVRQRDGFVRRSKKLMDRPTYYLHEYYTCPQRSWLSARDHVARTAEEQTDPYFFSFASSSET